MIKRKVYHQLVIPGGPTQGNALYIKQEIILLLKYINYKISIDRGFEIISIKFFLFIPFISDCT